MKKVKFMFIAVAITLPTLAQANFSPNLVCAQVVASSAIGYATGKGYTGCHISSKPYFDMAKSATSGLVSVDLNCTDGNQLQVNMYYLGDQNGNCKVSKPRLWNP